MRRSATRSARRLSPNDAGAYSGAEQASRSPPWAVAVALGGLGHVRRGIVLAAVASPRVLKVLEPVATRIALAVACRTDAVRPEPLREVERVKSATVDTAPRPVVAIVERVDQVGGADEAVLGLAELDADVAQKQRADAGRLRARVG